MPSTNVPVTQAPLTPADPEPSSVGPSPSSDASSPSSAELHPSSEIDELSVSSELDELAAAAVDLARQAAIEIAEPDTVGEHLGVTLDEGGLTMHSFRCTARGYRGWRWAVTLAHVQGSDRVTVCDTVLLPGTDSIQAPAWVPWSDRLAPGDLGAGDDLPYRADDPLLVPGYTVTDEDDSDQRLFWELGLGRERVIGLEGLQAAAARWERGPHGPTSELAIQASAACVTCAFLVPVSGFLRSHFGVCTNEWSPADGTVVTTDFGCGAHSETDLELPAPEPLPAHILDETIIEEVFVDRAEDGPVEDGVVEDGLVEDGPVGDALVEDGPVGDTLVEDVAAEPAPEPSAEVPAESVAETAERLPEIPAEPVAEATAEAAERLPEAADESSAEAVESPES